MAIACCGADFSPFRCDSTPTQGVMTAASCSPVTTAITPGMLMAAQDLLKQQIRPDRDQIREHLSGNYCRCTGYQAIIDAVETTARARAGRTA